MGHTVLEAGDGREGLRMVDLHQPDIVTVDLLMPEMDGLAFLTTLRASDTHLPVIVISADIQDEPRRECEHLGARFLNKPIKEHDLANALATVPV